MADHGPQITAARLYRLKSASGNDYFAGMPAALDTRTQPVIR